LACFRETRYLTLPYLTYLLKRSFTAKRLSYYRPCVHGEDREVHGELGLERVVFPRHVGQRQRPEWTA